jgi:hypothetical protein
MNFTTTTDLELATLAEHGPTPEMRSAAAAELGARLDAQGRAVLYVAGDTTGTRHEIMQDAAERLDWIRLIEHGRDPDGRYFIKRTKLGERVAALLGMGVRR